VRYRDRQLLVRFRAGAAEVDKASAISSFGGRRQRQLRGESEVEKLELQTGQDPETVGNLLRLNPIIEFAEPNFSNSSVGPGARTRFFDGTRYSYARGISRLEYLSKSC